LSTEEPNYPTMSAFNREDPEPDFHPAPKPARVVSPEAIEFVRTQRDGKVCLVLTAFQTKFGKCTGAHHVHHIDSRGSGGDDIPENLITLCTFHHDKVHRGQITKRMLRKILSKFFGYEYEEVK